SIGGSIFGPARGKRFAVLRQGEWSDGKEHEKIIGAQRRHAGPFLEFQAHRDGLAVEAGTQGLDPRVDRFRAVLEDQKLSSCSASGWEADIVFGVSPIEANKGSKCFGGLGLHVGSPYVWYSSTKGHACLRSAKAL